MNATLSRPHSGHAIVTRNTNVAKPALIRKIQRRLPFTIERLPWIARVYRYPINRWSGFGRRALLGSVHFLVVFLYQRLWPWPGKGAFRLQTGCSSKQIRFDARNTQFSALYLREWRGGYEAHIAALLDLITPSEGVFLDIGSNWGWFSLYLGSRPDFRGHIHAFEPLPAAFEDLQNCVRQAHLEARVRCHHLALSDRIGRAAMRLPDGFQSGQAVMVQAKGLHDRGFVRTVTLDSMELPLVSVIKMDVEGAEARVIRGGTETLLRDKPMIVLENAKEGAHACTTLEPLRLLGELGYAFFQVGWRKTDRNISYYLSDDCDSDPQAEETLSLMPFGLEERFLKPHGMNIFACHRERLPELSTCFESVP